MNAAVIVAGGRGARFGRETGKQLVPIAGRPMLRWTVAAFGAARRIDSIVVTFEAEQLDLLRGLVAEWGASKVVAVVPGGDERQDSVALGLDALPCDATVVAVHDGARPLVLPEDIDAAIDALPGWDGVVLGRSVVDTVKQVDANGAIQATLQRATLWQAETPQVFEVSTLKDAYEAARRDALRATDDAALVEHAGGRVRMLAARGPNLKVTVPDDVTMAQAIVEARMIEAGRGRA